MKKTFLIFGALGGICAINAFAARTTQNSSLEDVNITYVCEPGCKLNTFQSGQGDSTGIGVVNCTNIQTGQPCADPEIHYSKTNTKTNTKRANSVSQSAYEIEWLCPESYCELHVSANDQTQTAYCQNPRTGERCNDPITVIYNDKGKRVLTRAARASNKINQVMQALDLVAQETPVKVTCPTGCFVKCSVSGELMFCICVDAGGNTCDDPIVSTYERRW